MSGFGDFIWCCMMTYDMYTFGDVCLYPLQLLRNFILHVVLESVEDVTCIS